jgi:hypothetical protein
MSIGDYGFFPNLLGAHYCCFLFTYTIVIITLINYAANSFTNNIDCNKQVIVGWFLLVLLCTVLLMRNNFMKNNLTILEIHYTTYLHCSNLLCKCFAHNATYQIIEVLLLLSWLLL